MSGEGFNPLLKKEKLASKAVASGLFVIPHRQSEFQYQLEWNAGFWPSPVADGLRTTADAERVT